eukprot:1152230-Pelagomonas_calceolata.AAC.4
MATKVALLLLGGLKLVLGPGGVAVAGAECSLFPPRPPLFLNGYLELVLGQPPDVWRSLRSGDLVEASWNLQKDVAGG